MRCHDSSQGTRCDAVEPAPAPAPPHDPHGATHRPYPSPSPATQTNAGAVRDAPLDLRCNGCLSRESTGGVRGTRVGVVHRHRAQQVCCKRRAAIKRAGERRRGRSLCQGRERERGVEHDVRVEGAAHRRGEIGRAHV